MRFSYLRFTLSKLPNSTPFFHRRADFLLDLTGLLLKIVKLLTSFSPADLSSSECKLMRTLYPAAVNAACAIVAPDMASLIAFRFPPIAQRAASFITLSAYLTVCNGTYAALIVAI